jgi:hypothetical protein
MSKGSRSKLTLVTTFTLALGAGLVVGIAAAKRGAAAALLTRPSTEQTTHSRSAATELNLTAQQQEQVKGIWAGVTQGPVKTLNEKRKSLQKERDDAINRLFTSEQKVEYDRIQTEYASKSADLNKQRQQHFDAAVEQVKRILNDTQRQKYEQMLKERGGHGRHGLGGPGREGRNATTRPAAAGAIDSQNSGRPFAAPNSSQSPAPTSRPSGDPS